MALNLRNGEQLWSQEIFMSAINEADEQKKDYNVLKNDFIKDPSKRLKSFKRENETLQKWNSTNPVFRRLYSEQYSEIMAGVQNLQGSLHQQAFFGNDTIYAHGVAMGDQSISDVLHQMSKKMERINNATEFTEFSTTFGINQHAGKMGFLVTGHTMRGSNRDLVASPYNENGTKFNAKISIREAKANQWIYNEATFNPDPQNIYPEFHTRDLKIHAIFAEEEFYNKNKKAIDDFAIENELPIIMAPDADKGTIGTFSKMSPNRAKQRYTVKTMFERKRVITKSDIIKERELAKEKSFGFGTKIINRTIEESSLAAREAIEIGDKIAKKFNSVSKGIKKSALDILRKGL